MGCAQSRIENEEAVLRCKDRRNFMKEAVTERNAFAAGHSAYAVALKNTGAALSDYGHGEAEIVEPNDRQPSFFGDDGGPGSVGASTATTMDGTTIQPPPPPPNFSPSPLLLRNFSLPEFPQKPDRKNLEPIIMNIPEDEAAKEAEGDGHPNSRRGGSNEMNRGKPLPPPSPPKTPPTPPLPELKAATWDYFFLENNMEGGSFDENEEEEGEEEETAEVLEDQKEYDGNLCDESDDAIEPMTPERPTETLEETPPPLNKVPTNILHSKSDPSEFIRRGNAVSGVTLLHILSALDEHFLKASESAQEVSKMLEANRLHYHSNFADNRGHIDHSERVMRVITWNSSFKDNANGSGHDDPDSDEYETHATVLDKLLAWEKKLYDEVKAAELMKLEYRRKIALLSKQKKRGVSAESLEKTKAAVTHLHTRYIVDMQSLDSTAAEVNHLRDDRLYPRLVLLVDEAAKMWENKFIHHGFQLKAAMELKSIELPQTPKATTKQHHEQTIQLMKVVHEWQFQFENLVNHQKRYIRSLNSWLKLNLIPIESSLKEKPPPPSKFQNPPIQILLSSWQELLENPQDDLTKAAISSFADAIKTLVDYQSEEMKAKERWEETRREYTKKRQAFEEWHQKYVQKGEDANMKDPVVEKQFVVESLRKRMEEEAEEHRRQCVLVREKSLGCLRIRLPELFRALLDYTLSCSEIYKKLRGIATGQDNSIGAPP